MDPVAIGEILSILLFIGVCTTLMLGYPISFSLAGTALIFAAIGWAMGILDFHILNGMAARYYGVMMNEVLVSVPLFIFMGMILERSGLAEQLLTTMGELFGSLRGGLGYSVVLVGALLAASTGVVGATVVTMGLISLPAMLRAGYDPKLATGVICASSTLAQIIPPSTVLIFVANMLQSVNQTAQSKMGNFAPEAVSVGDLFAGALIPGLILTALYLLWITYKAIFEPESCPALPSDPVTRKGLLGRVAVALLPALALILAVLGSILFGIATPTESASLGALGAMALAAARGRLNYPMLKQATVNTAVTTCMVFVILFGASVFSLVFRGFGGEALVEDALRSMPGGAFGAMAVVMFIMFILGFFLDTFEIIFIMLPICGVPLLTLGLDPIWLGVMIGVNLQTSFLTPPFGFTLFYMRGVAPESVTTSQIWIGSISWTFLQVFGLALVWYFTPLATWLPHKIFREEQMQIQKEGGGAGKSNFMDVDDPDNPEGTK